MAAIHDYDCHPVADSTEPHGSSGFGDEGVIAYGLWPLSRIEVGVAR
jgi:hypothetical protein